MSDSDQKKLKELPVIPLRNMVLFPGVVQPIDVGRAKSLAVADKAAQASGMRIAVLTQVVPEVAEHVGEAPHPRVAPAAVETLRVLDTDKGAAGRAERGAGSRHGPRHSTCPAALGYNHTT